MKKFVLFALALSLLIVGQFDSASAKGKQTAKSQKAEDVCVFQSSSCLKNCDFDPANDQRTILSEPMRQSHE